MKRKETFAKKYPLFSVYFPEISIRTNMVDNEDLSRKYKAHEEIIEIFIHELSTHFDFDVIKKIIIEGIVKAPDDLMVSLITAYLNSSEETKKNPDFIAFYGKISNFGVEATKYIEKHGIITNRDYKNIPDKIIDERYNKIKSGYEEFKGVKVDQIYKTLTYAERRLIIDLIESNILLYFDEIFESLNISLPVLLDLLINYKVDGDILNQEVYRNLGAHYLMILVCLLLDNEDTIGSVDSLKRVCIERRYALLKEIIDNNLLLALSHVNYEELQDKEINEVIEILRKKELVLKKEEN